MIETMKAQNNEWFHKDKGGKYPNKFRIQDYRGNDKIGKHYNPRAK